MSTGRLTLYLKGNWGEVVMAGLITAIGAALIGWGAHLLRVLPQEGEPSADDAWLLDTVVGIDGNLYSRKKVIHAARIAMVAAGCALIVLAWILPIIHLVRVRPGKVTPVASPGK